MPTAFEGFEQGGSIIPVKDTTARNSITAILDGANIDSFSDVETALSNKVDTSSLGQNSGVATLDANGKVPSSQIPAGVGTAVEGNPTEAATAGDLTKIKIDSDIYSIPSGGGGGTTVVPNPSGTATADLNKVQIGTDIYSIPQTDISGKADKVSSPTSGDFASLDSNGNLTDSGNKASDFASSAIMDGTTLDSFGDVESALDEKFPRSEQAVLGAKNLIPYPYADGMSKETNGITFTVQNDGSVVANGTATGQALFELWKINTFKLPIGKAVTLNGGIDNKAMIQYWAASDFDYKTQGSDVSFTPTTDALASGRLTIFVDTGKTLNNAVFKPMIRLATDTDSTYAPYAKTNRELTEDVANIPTVSVTHTGTASSTGVRKQQITVNNVSYDVDGSAYMEQSVTLSTSQSTDVVFTNAIIADGTELTFSSSIWDLVPDDMVTTTGVCTVTLPKWTSAVTIGCRLRVR